MAKLIGIDVSAHTITLQFDYEIDAEDLIMDIIKSIFGKDLQLSSFRKAINEINIMFKDE